MHLILMPIHLFPRWTGSGLSFKKRMIMQVKLISLLLFIGCLQVSARGYGQQVTINVHETSIIEVCQSIRKQTGHLFVYDLNMIQEANKVSLNVKNMALDKALTECFKDRSEEHTSELQSLMRLSYDVFCLKTKHRVQK